MNTNAIHPIIYVRGYAMTQSEIEDTVADPYMGFNLGSCKVRQMWDGKVRKYFFESPLVRLLKQFGYRDVYEEGSNRVGGGPETDAERFSVPYRSIVIYRYYEPSSDDLGTGEKPDMKRFASGLGTLILDLRRRIYPEGAATVISDDEKAVGKLPYDQFRVYLVAHSMGGLVVRAFLQNPAFGSAEPRALVDKVFTYATPHNGIEIGVLGNVPSWLSLYGMSSFNREVMASLLGLPDDQSARDGVDIITNFDAGRVFNLVGTDPGDYKVAAGLSSSAVGEASDGLVRIKNATTRSRSQTGFVASPNAFVHRSHSGYFGIVNSEEGYQNLVRFLFGDVRADGQLEIDEITLPKAVQQEKDAKKDVRASYLFEVTISIRGKPWQLHRRIASENSAIVRKFDDLFTKDPVTNAWEPIPTAGLMLFNVFLDMGQSQTKDTERPTVAFAADICVRATEYEVDGLLFFKNHFEGGYLFRDMVTLEAAPPTPANPSWTITYQFASQSGGDPQNVKNLREDDDVLSFDIPIEQPNPPGIKARLHVETRFWNNWQA
jgi:hypothetical protein